VAAPEARVQGCPGRLANVCLRLMGSGSWKARILPTASACAWGHGVSRPVDLLEGGVCLLAWRQLERGESRVEETPIPRQHAAWETLRPGP